MKTLLKIEKYSVHLWQAFVPELLTEIPSFSRLLNESEMARANRFHFEAHRHRYIIARAVLRQLLSLYVPLTPEAMVFKLGPRGKPYLENNKIDLQFNVSHSHDMAIYAFTMHTEIGVDIEKIEPRFNEAVAKRFFSAQEYAELMALPDHEKIPAFYRLWAGKEAIIKALGEGLYTPLADFSLDLEKDVQTIALENRYYHLEHVPVHADYQAAFATPQIIKTVSSHRFSR